MSTPAVIPWVQYSEDVVGENEPNGLSDVDNRPLKFVLTQSDIAVTDAFPGFMVRHLGTASPEGVQTAGVGAAFVDTTNEQVYIKMTTTGNTGWQLIGGNLFGTNSPEGVVTADIGQLYEQRNAALTANAVWYKSTGGGNTGWRRMLGFDTTTGAIVVGAATDTTNAGATAVLVGPGAVSADGASAIAIGNAPAADAADSIGIGRAISINSACVDGIAIGRQNTLAATGIVGMIAIGAGNTVAEDHQIVIGGGISAGAGGTGSIYIGSLITAGAAVGVVCIGRNMTVGTQASDVLIGNGASTSGGSGVAIAGSITTGGSNGSVAILGTINGGVNGSSVCIGGSITNNEGATAVGRGTVISGSNGTAFGNSAQVTATSGIALGSGAVVGHSNSISIGDGDTWQAQMCNIGFNVALNGINMLAIGHGMDTKSSPASLLFRLTNGSGADNAAGNLTCQPGLSTGNAAAGVFKVQVGDAGASGAVVQTAAVKFVVGRTVGVGATVSTTAALSITLTATHAIETASGRCVFGGSAANTLNTGGITINQAALDDEILSFKSSDVAHGMTTLTETDTFATFAKTRGANGGLAITAYDDASAEGVLVLTGIIGAAAADTTKTTAGRGVVIIDAKLKSGNTSAALGANENMVSFSTAGTTRFILDADGDSHQDVGTAWTNFDTHDDVALLNRLSAHVTRVDDPLRASFASWLEGGRDELQRLKLVTFNEDGHHFVNMSRLSMLHTGAIRQLAERFNRIEAALQRLLPSEA